MLSYMNNRMREILKLLSEAESYVTSEELAKSLEVTSRTIRGDIKTLNDAFVNYNVKISSKKGSGYRLMYHSNKDFNRLSEQIDKLDALTDLNPVTPEDRTRYIVKRLLYSKKDIKILTLMDELYVSETTIKKDIQYVKAVLNKYNIRIVKTNSGIHAAGHEVNKRFCISDYLIYRTQLEDDIILDLINSNNYLVTKNDLDHITEILLQHLSDPEMEVSDDALKKIAVHTAILISRYKSGKSIDVNTEGLSELTNESEYKISRKIINAMNMRFGLSLSEDEVAYLTMHLVGNRVLHKELKSSENLSDLLGERVYQLSNAIINEVDSWMAGIDITNDEELIYSLGLHLKQLMTRLSFNMNFRNPLLDKIKIKYPLAFEAGVISAKAIMKETGYRVNESEIGFLALHFGVAIERKTYHPSNKKKIALVCASGMATSELLLAKVSNLLNDNYYMMGAYALHQLEELLEQKPDIILTTVPIERDIDIPFLLVPTILDDNDVIDVKQFLDKPNGGINVFTQFMKKELFFPKAKFKTKLEALNVLTDQMISKGFISDETKQSIMSREQIAPTAIGNFVAIPHPVELNNDQSCICTSILESEVSWSDSEEVALIFIIVLEEKWRSKFQEIFTALYDIIHSSENILELIKKEDYEGFIQKIESL
ncbi:transcription antiterminator [Paraliobacillus sp. JSM ZJ581]|uniref:BglG family transcription antiterminator n=1 Tax=Paraliobacillus sp. JSM ZJ581 TaxID=3342118 RepID=UPI0035A93892